MSHLRIVRIKRFSGLLIIVITQGCADAEALGQVVEEDVRLVLVVTSRSINQLKRPS